MKLALLNLYLLALFMAWRIGELHERIKAFEERQPAQPTPSPVLFRWQGEGQEPPALKEPDLA